MQLVGNRLAFAHRSAPWREVPIERGIGCPIEPSIAPLITAVINPGNGGALAKSAMLSVV